MAQKTIVALLFGGRSAEHDVSLVSAAAVFRNLDPRKYKVLSLYITKSGRWKIVPSPIASRSTLMKGRGLDFLPWTKKGRGAGLDADIYFPVLHGPFGEDGTVQGLLEMAGVPYVGAGVLGSALGMDKAASKTLLKSAGLPVVPFRVVPETDWRRNRAALLRLIRKEFRRPYFVKPSNLGSSVGITKVKKDKDAAAAIERAFRYDRKVLVEKGVAGRELECSVLGNDEPEASLPGEVIPHREFYDYNDKYIDGKTGFVIPARLPAALVAEVRRLAVAAFRALDLAGMARVDFFLERTSGRLYVNEVNTIPGFTEISMYPKLWAASGLPFPALVDRLVALGFERHRARRVCVERERG